MKYVRRFSELGMDDVPSVGGKNASLGEMYRSLKAQGVQVPNGFATTADGYRHYIEHNDLESRIAATLKDLDTEDVKALQEAGRSIRQWVAEGEMPEDMAKEIREAYAEICEEYGADTDVAVRSSATAEDLPDASFAGQQETYLNISGADEVIDICRKVFASLFTDRAISYRVHKGFTHMEVALSAGIQKMVRSDLASSGVMFTLDTESGFRDVVFITGSWGLGENVVQGAVNPDEWYVYKNTLEQGFRPILKRHLGSKAIKMIYTDEGEETTRNIDVPAEERSRYCLNDDEVLTLARYAVIIEKHYSELAGQSRPMDIEWAKDGRTGDLFIVQARPETVHSQVDMTQQEVFKLNEKGEVLTTGKSVGQKVAAGKARIIESIRDMEQLNAGEVLVTDMTDPDWEPVMKRAAAIVTRRGGRTCHAAIIARELGIPAVVGAADATETIPDGAEVTVSCAEGDTGYIYSGKLDFEIKRIDFSEMPRPKTKIMVNVGNPERAFEFQGLPSDGVGLARLEFIINNAIRIHPRALLEPERIEPEVKAEIDKITAGYEDKRQYYVDRLAEGVGTIAASFYPRPVIARMSDFKSNEYAALIGGSAFEPSEENPMLGYRGASRYYSKDFSASFAMECEAMRKVRDEMGLTNLQLMIPFGRSVEEVKRVLGLMAEHGLERGRNDLKINLMCEIPANALLAEQFLELVDGLSIGSNDLTQLTLGVDRDSGLLTGFDERNEAVLKLMEMAIEACNRQDKYVGICGQAPSDFPEITRWLVQRGIKSISLNPDSVLPMLKTVLATEEELKAG